MSKFNFINITLQSKANITDVMDNFNKIELEAATEEDLPKSKRITLSKGSWTQNGSSFEYKISDSLIKEHPYNIDVYFTNLSLIESAILPKANSQTNGSIILTTLQKPSVDLVADLIVTRVVE